MIEFKPVRKGFVTPYKKWEGYSANWETKLVLCTSEFPFPSPTYSFLSFFLSFFLSTTSDPFCPNILIIICL